MEHIKVLIAKAGLDGHDRGAKVVCQALRDAGMEVVYTGIRQTAEQIAETALEEDVKFIGLSSLSGAHMNLFPKVRQMLDAKGMADVVVFGGGVIPDEDAAKLKAQGIREIFFPGASFASIVGFIQEEAKRF